MVDITPLGDGRATYISDDSVEATFPLSTQMKGWKMEDAFVDSSGYFLTIRWTKDKVRGEPKVRPE